MELFWQTIADYNTMTWPVQALIVLAAGAPRGGGTEVAIRLPRKSAKYMSGRPVPQTDTGGRVEHTKALERFTVKELGKLTP